MRARKVLVESVAPLGVSEVQPGALFAYRAAVRVAIPVLHGRWVASAAPRLAAEGQGRLRRFFLPWPCSAAGMLRLVFRGAREGSAGRSTLLPIVMLLRNFSSRTRLLSAGNNVHIGKGKEDWTSLVSHRCADPQTNKQYGFTEDGTKIPHATKIACGK